MYTVAEHCVRMSKAVPPSLAYDALMHELGEATCGDVTGPLKSLCPDFKKIEKRCERAAFTMFMVPMSDPDAIKLADLRMLATERRDLLAWRGEQWGIGEAAKPFDFEIVPWSPEAAAGAFLRRYREIAPEGAPR